MAREQYFQQALASHESIGSKSPPQMSNVSAATASDSPHGCFDCNICLDNAQEPVVTLCGHLYCWPCIYKWLHFQEHSFTPDELQQCPVCKADISQTTLVPLYGRGQSTQNETKDEDSLQALKIPSRPQAYTDALMTTTTSRPSRNILRNPFRSQSGSQSPRHSQYPDSYVTEPTVLPTVMHPMIGMFGEMVYTRVFGNAQASSLHWYPNTYGHMSTSPRARMQEMQAEKSLSRISNFLFCCFVLCLLLF